MFYQKFIVSFVLLLTAGLLPLHQALAAMTEPPPLDSPTHEIFVPSATNQANISPLRQPAEQVDAQALHTIKVDANRTVRSLSQRPIGINMNFIMDDDANRLEATTPITEALRSMGVKYLRYPGGEKSDTYLWSVPPFKQSIPRLARIGTCEWPSGSWHLVESDLRTFKFDPLDFDEFMSLARAIGAEPVIVINYDSMYKGSACGGITPTRNQLLKTAVAWVRYANIKKRYGVKYWEIGNESYLNAYNGGTTADQYAQDLVEFSQAMKAVDPSIQIGANGLLPAWWQTVLPIASPYIDYLSVHEYPATGWKSYEFYRTRTPNLVTASTRAAQAIDRYAQPADRERLKVAVTELSSADWGNNGWPHVNDTGHALVLFDLLGNLLKKPRVEFSQFWNTRWVNNDNGSTPELHDALNHQNVFNPTGTILQIWGTFMQDRMVFSTQTTMVRTFATSSADQNRLVVLLLNKDTTSHTAAVTLSNFSTTASSAQRYLFAGTSPNDLAPTWGQVDDIPVSPKSFSVELPPLSVTVVELVR